MPQVMELSIFYFLFFSFLGAAEPLFAKPGNIQAPPQQDLPVLSFLSQAEDIEREAWWIITSKRVDPAASPFRVLRAAVAGSQKSQKINYKFCKSLMVLKQGPNAWRIESACQKPTREIGVVQKLSHNPEKWKISWKTEAFSEHFGMSTAILYSQQSCEIELDLKSRISRLSCPQYVRDRKISEIVEFKVFDYQAEGPQILKLEGEVKKELQIIATFKTEVPLIGDIVLKVKKVPQKAVEEKTEFSNMEPPATTTRGDANGSKEGAQDNEKDRSEKNVEARPEEPPPIEVPAIAPSR